MARRIEHLMGTVVSVDVRTPAPAAVLEPALDAFFATIADIDARFSPYRSDSEISRIADGTLAESEASPDVRFVLAACDHLAEATDGVFDARRHRSDGRLDPSGFVKGWAIDEASRYLDDARLDCYAVNAGGDLLVKGRPQADQGWRVGIQHPAHRDRLAARLEIAGGAVATSGLYERGDHIRDPRSGEVARELASVTVIGPELTWADAYATAAFTMGVPGLDWVERHAGYGAIGVTHDEQLFWTPTAAPALTNISGAETRI